MWNVITNQGFLFALIIWGSQSLGFRDSYYLYHFKIMFHFVWIKINPDINREDWHDLCLIFINMLVFTTSAWQLQLEEGNTLVLQETIIEEPREEVIKWSLCCYKPHLLQESTGEGNQSPADQWGRLWGLGLELTLEGQKGDEESKHWVDKDVTCC